MKRRERPSAHSAFAQTVVRKALAALSRPRLHLVFLGALLVWGVTSCGGAETLAPMGPMPATAAPPSKPTPTWARAVAGTGPTNTPTRVPTFTKAVALATNPTRPATQPAQSNRPAQWQMTILHTNDVRGYLDPCG